MNTSETATTSQTTIIYSTLIPSLGPSITFCILFTLATILHLYRTAKFRRRVYLYLSIFSFVRTCAFATRIVWSQNPNDKMSGVFACILWVGGFFVVMEALYTLLRDWIHILVPDKLPIYERQMLRVAELLLPVFSVAGIVASIKEFDAQSDLDHAVESMWRKAYIVGFMALLLLYLGFVTYFAVKYGKEPVYKQLKALVLYTSAALLLIELVCRSYVIFEQSSNPINKYEWVFYTFETLPEMVLMVILGGVILGEWFHKNPGEVELAVALKVKSAGVQNTELVGSPV